MKAMFDTLIKFESVMSNKGENFVTGNQVTFADWLYYY